MGIGLMGRSTWIDVYTSIRCAVAAELLIFCFLPFFDDSITIFYFAKEGLNCTFTPVYPEFYTPTKIPFQKGLDQKFFQPSGTGIDLGFFEMNELSNSTTAEDIFPLVIYVEAFPHPSTDVESGQTHSKTSPHTQITQAVLDETKDSQYQVRVIKQILWIDEVRYELCELYGIGNSDKSGFDDSEPGKECVICMMEPKNTAVLPCRHMVRAPTFILFVNLIGKGGKRVLRLFLQYNISWIGNGLSHWPPLYDLVFAAVLVLWSVYNCSCLCMFWLCLFAFKSQITTIMICLVDWFCFPSCGILVKKKLIHYFGLSSTFV